MSQSSGGPDLTYEANSDLSTHVYKFVKVVAGPKLDLAGASDRPVGILQNKPAAGQAAAFRYVGTSKLIVDGSTTAIAVGDMLKPDASGRGIKTTTDGDEVGAMALEASTQANDVIEVLVVNRQR